MMALDHIKTTNNNACDNNDACDNNIVGTF